MFKVFKGEKTGVKMKELKPAGAALLLHTLSQRPSSP